jgi:hypothetical protein
MTHTDLKAGKHCKTSYCPHRGNCEVFAPWAAENLKLAWFPSDVAALTDDELADAMEQAEILRGWDKTLRGEALRRMVHMDRRINGYKVVKGKQDRAWANKVEYDKVVKRLADLGIPESALFERTDLSPAGVERIIKGYAKPMGRGAWVELKEQVMPASALTLPGGSLSVESVIDGRKEHKKGSEFGPIGNEVKGII